MAHVGGYGFSSSTINSATTSENVEYALVGSKSAGVISTINKMGVITANPSTSTITATNFDGFIKTVSTTAATAHFLNFSDSAGTGFGNPQKVSTVSVIPNTGIITANGLSNTTALRLNNTSTGEISIGFTGSAGSNVVNVNNGAASTGSINIGNGTGTSTQNINIGRNNAIQILNGSGTTGTLITGGGINLVGAVRLNAQGDVNNTVSIASQGGMTSSAFIEIGAGSSSAQPISIGNGATASGTITIGGSNGTQGKTTLIGSRDIQIGNATAGTSLVTVRQNTSSLAAGHLGHTVRTTIASQAFPSGPGNTYYQFGTMSVPAFTVALISVTCNFTANEGTSATKHGAVVSETSASGTSIGAGFSFWEERDTQSGSVALQATDTLSGVYVNTTNAAVTLYVNAVYNQAWTGSAPTFSGSTSVTKIG